MRSTQYLKIALAVGIIAVVLLLVQSFGFVTVLSLALVIIIGPIVIMAALLRWQNISLKSPMALQLFISFAVMLLFLYSKPFGIGIPYNVIIFVCASYILLRIVDRFTGSPTTYQTYIKRIMAGGAEDIIKELKDRADHSSAELVALSAAYSWQGDGEQAEVYARRALELHPLSDKPSRLRGQRFVEWMHAAVLADAFTAQGRFAEAITEISRVDRLCHAPDMTTIEKALLALCAGDEDQARRFIESVPSVTTRLGLKNSVSPKYQFMYFYLQHRLLGMERRPHLREMPAQLAEWEDAAVRNVGNPYGQRLREILADIHEVMK